MDRILIYGNSGSGKSTMARTLAADRGLPQLDLDEIAWESPGVRLPVARSRGLVRSFIDTHPEWVIEGSYGTLIEAATPFCTELRFLNPGVDACVENCRRRPWEPHKYGSKEEQDEMLNFLLDWVRSYGRRDDEYSLSAHRALYDQFAGVKLEFVEL